MGNEELVKTILNSSNFNTIKDSMNEFTKQYVKKLLTDIILYVDGNISLGDISYCDSYHLNCELSQEIVGIPSVYSAVDGDTSALIAFAESYSKLGVTEFDSLCQEVLVDFLNLHNGLFVVDLSEQNICELSLSVPKQEGTYEVCPENEFVGKVLLIPVTFSYGTVTFILLEKAC